MGWGGWVTCPVGLYCQPQSHSLSSGLSIWDLGLGFGTGLGLDNSSIKSNHKMLVTKCDRRTDGHGVPRCSSLKKKKIIKYGVKKVKNERPPIGCQESRVIITPDRGLIRETI